MARAPGLHQRLHAAEVLLDAGNAESALNGVNEVLQKNAEHADALALRARCLIALQRWDEAEQTANELLAIEPDEARGLLLLTVTAERGRPPGKNTLAAAERVLAADPDMAHAWYLKALAHDNLGTYKSAEPAYREALEREPDDADYLSAFADFLSKTGRKDEAQELLQRAGEVDPSNIAVLVASGTEDLRAGRRDEAMDKALWALQQDANDRSAIGLLVSIKTAQNPIMGIWWRWASLMERMSNGQRWAVIIGLYLVWQFFSRTVLRGFPAPVQIIAVATWLGFCILTWVGPSIFRRAIAKELKKVEVHRF